MELCEKCRYYVFDDESGEYFCDLALDEDEYVSLLSELGQGKKCRYFAPDIDEYGIVRKQN